MRNLESLKDGELVDIIWTTISDHAVFANTWKDLIFDDSICLSPQLMNRVFCLWFGSCMDTIKEEQVHYLALLGHARKRNLNNCVSYLLQFGNFVESIKRRIRVFSEDQQIVIIHVRNTIAHGRIVGVFQDNVKVTFLAKSDDRVKSAHMARNEYWRIINAADRIGFDSYLTPLRENFFQPGSEYINNIQGLTQPHILDNMRLYCMHDIAR